MKPNIVLAQTNALIREGIKSVINNGETPFNTLEANSKQSLLKQLETPSVKLLIFGFSNSSDFNRDTYTKIKSIHNDLKTLIISNEQSKNHILPLLESDINGYLTDKCDLNEVTNAIKSILNGDKFFCNTMINVLLEKNNPEQNCFPSKLSDRETEITKLIAQGLTSKQMADKLFLSTHTINTHRKNIMKKIGAKGASEVILYAINEGIVKPS